MLVTKVPMKNQPKIRPVLRVSNLISLRFGPSGDRSYVSDGTGPDGRRSDPVAGRGRWRYVRGVAEHTRLQDVTFTFEAGTVR